MEQIRSADVLANFPQVDEEKLNAALAAEAAASNRKIIVLDDDPTGVQTVHDIYVYTDWTVESLRKGFAAPEKLFFILTNSRGFTVAETTKAHREIAENTAKVAREFGMDYLIISRGDSTLRGHYPLETDLLREVTEAENGYKMDGDILCPYFREGGRFTLDNVHYVRYGAELVPCGQTEFAKDETFGYHASNLCEYIEEKTGGKVRAGDVICISLESLRAMDFDGIEAQLLAVHDYGHVIVNAVADCDVKVFAVALYRAMAKGRHFTIRSAAALVKAIGNISDQPLLTREKMVTQESKAGGIIVVGSHTKKTTAQLEELKKVQGIEFIEMDSDKVLVPGELERKQPPSWPTAHSRSQRHHLLRVHKARGAHPAGRHPGSSPRAQRCHQRCTAELRGQADRFPGFCSGKGRHHQQRRGREGPAREMRQGAGPDPAGHPGMADRCRKPVPRHAVHYLPGQCGRSAHPAGSGGNFAGLTA